MRKVEVIAYTSDWKKKFEEEAILLKEILGSEVINIHHIGSTSVKDLLAKPVIDMLPVVKDITQVERFNKAMIAIGYEPRGENGLPGRRYFQKGGNHRTHHVHVYEEGNPEIERHLAFRDYLRVHPEAAQEYGDLKERLSKQFPYDIASYINGKEQLASEIENKAMMWFKGMEKERDFHRVFGVYGICIQDEKLLVINKNGGPYINRFDLPGGNLEVRESLVNAMKREFLEETGLEIDIIKNIGTTDFFLSSDWRGHTDVHHIAVYYLVKQVGGELIVPEQFEGQDSLGALWVAKEQVSKANASPLVLEAFKWIKSKKLSSEVTYYNDWVVKKENLKNVRK